jgi:adenylate cyclase
MARTGLKSILGKKNETAAFILSFIEKINAPVWVTDEGGKLLLGTAPDPAAQEGAFAMQAHHSFPITFEDELMGWVKGDAKGNIVADLLVHLLSKEAERKNLGTEVLNLYQEVNLMFNFSEMLAQTIEPAAIAKTTLDETSRLIKSNTGVVVLWDEKSKALQVIASSGELFFNQEKINSNRSLLLKIILSGQSEIIGDISSLADAEIILPQVKTVLYAALKVNHRVMGAIILARHELIQYTAGDLKLLTTLALQSSAAIESALLYEKNIREAKEREEAMRRVYEATAKFVPYEFIRSLGHTVITDVKLGDQAQKVVTVLFTDIRDYTTLAEQMTPEENFHFVCSLNESLGPMIRKHNGFVNQYLGDSIMAIFPGSAADALHAAIDMQKKLQEFNHARKINNQPPVKIGIGMHTGPLIMGITGDLERMDAATISDTVNTASRIESLTKYYRVSILLSDASLQQVQQPQIFHLRPLGKVQVKGKKAPVGIYECFSGNTDDEISKKEITLAAFNQGMASYLDKSFSDAIHSFTQVIQAHPADHTTEFFIEKATRYIKNGVPANWAGVEEMMNK